MSSSTGAPPQGTENGSKRRESGSKEFIGTLPGLLAGVAALITAIAGAFYGGTQLAGRPQVQPTVFVTVTARASPAPAATTGGHPTIGATPPAAATTPAATQATFPAGAILTYKVTGSPAHVTYGPSGSNIAGNSPMAVTAKLSNAQAYSVSAQLLGGGGTVTVETLVNGKVFSTGTASGGYHIAWAQICPGPTTGQWQSCN